MTDDRLIARRDITQSLHDFIVNMLELERTASHIIISLSRRRLSLWEYVMFWVVYT